MGSLSDGAASFEAIKAIYGEDAYAAEVYWRGMSGHAHGYSYAVQLTSKTERSVPVPGGQSVVVTIGDDSFNAHAMTAGLLLVRAIQRYSRLSEVPVSNARAENL